MFDIGPRLKRFASTLAYYGLWLVTKKKIHYIEFGVKVLQIFSLRLTLSANRLGRFRKFLLNGLTFTGKAASIKLLHVVIFHPYSQTLNQARKLCVCHIQTYFALLTVTNSDKKGCI
jgi:hypothetical protein